MKQGHQPTEHIENPMPPKCGPAYVPGKRKTEQEVRAAVDREIGGSVLISGRYGHPEELSEVATLDIQDLAVIMGRALGIIE